jgi:hypothetical protein
MAAIAKKEYTVDVIVHSEAEQEFDSVSAGIQQIEDHASKIGENYVVAAEDLRELNQVFPGILQGMKQLEDGSIELNKTMV